MIWLFLFIFQQKRNHIKSTRSNVRRSTSEILSSRGARLEDDFHSSMTSSDEDENFHKPRPGQGSRPHSGTSTTGSPKTHTRLFGFTSFCSSIWVMSWPSCVAKALTLDITYKLFNQFLFIPAMLIDTIDFYHFILLPLTLTLAGGHKISAKQNLWAWFSCTFKLIRMKFNMVLKQLKLNTLMFFFLARVNEAREITSVLLTVYKKPQTFMNSFGSNLVFKLGMMIDTTELCILILVYVTLTLIQGHSSARKQKLP